jgi:hypothetical protein
VSRAPAEALVLFPASDALTLVGLDLQSSLAADVREMSRNRTPPAVAANARISPNENLTLKRPLAPSG